MGRMRRSGRPGVRDVIAGGAISVVRGGGPEFETAATFTELDTGRLTVRLHIHVGHGRDFAQQTRINGERAAVMRGVISEGAEDGGSGHAAHDGAGW